MCTRTGLLSGWRQRDEDQTTRRCPEISIPKWEWECRNEMDNTTRTSNMGGVGPVFLCLASSIFALAYPTAIQERMTRQASLDRAEAAETKGLIDSDDEEPASNTRSSPIPLPIRSPRPSRCSHQPHRKTFLCSSTDPC